VLTAPALPVPPASTKQKHNQDNNQNRFDAHVEVLWTKVWQLDVRAVCPKENTRWWEPTRREGGYFRSFVVQILRDSPSPFALSMKLGSFAWERNLTRRKLSFWRHRTGRVSPDHVSRTFFEILLVCERGGSCTRNCRCKSLRLTWISIRRLESIVCNEFSPKPLKTKRAWKLFWQMWQIRHSPNYLPRPKSRSRLCRNWWAGA